MRKNTFGQIKRKCLIGRFEDFNLQMLFNFQNSFNYRIFNKNDNSKKSGLSHLIKKQFRKDIDWDDLELTPKKYEDIMLELTQQADEKNINRMMIW